MIHPFAELEGQRLAKPTLDPRRRRATSPPFLIFIHCIIAIDDSSFEHSNIFLTPEELSMTVKVGDVSEVDAITKVLQVYMNAAKNGNREPPAHSVS